MGGGQHVGGGNLWVRGDDRAHQEATPGTGEVDADGACPVRLGDVLTMPRILAWRLKDPPGTAGPDTRRQGGGVDQLEGDVPGDLRGQDRGQQTDKVGVPSGWGSDR
jgi:hypothetical protein